MSVSKDKLEQEKDELTDKRNRLKALANEESEINDLLPPEMLESLVVPLENVMSNYTDLLEKRRGLIGEKLSRVEKIEDLKKKAELKLSEAQEQLNRLSDS